MNLTIEHAIMAASALAALLLLIFAVDWRFFSEWVVVFLLKTLLDTILGTLVVEMNYINYPVRLFSRVFETPVLFEFWVFPVLCVLYNQITRDRSLWPILYYAVLISAGITAVEYFLEKHTELIEYVKWHWYTSLIALTAVFLLSRAFMAFYRRGCRYFGDKGPRFRY